MLSEEEILERLANFMVVELPLYDSEVDSEYAKKVISASIFLDIVSGLRFHATKQNAAQKLKNIYNAISAYEKMIALRQEIVNNHLVFIKHGSIYQTILMTVSALDIRN